MEKLVFLFLRFLADHHHAKHRALEFRCLNVPLGILQFPWRTPFFFLPRHHLFLLSSFSEISVFPHALDTIFHFSAFMESKLHPQILQTVASSIYDYKSKHSNTPPTSTWISFKFTLISTHHIFHVTAKDALRLKHVLYFSISNYFRIHQPISVLFVRILNIFHTNFYFPFHRLNPVTRLYSLIQKFTLRIIEYQAHNSPQRSSSSMASL